MADVDDTDPSQPAAALVASTDGDGTLLLHLSGEIDIASVDSLRAAIEQKLEQHAPESVVFDLSGLRFMDSSGLSLLLSVAARIDKIQIQQPSPIIRRVIELSGLATTLPMSP
jgi:anti-sigma B factor antagonist